MIKRKLPTFEVVTFWFLFFFLLHCTKWSEESSHFNNNHCPLWIFIFLVFCVRASHLSWLCRSSYVIACWEIVVLREEVIKINRFKGWSFPFPCVIIFVSFCFIFITCHSFPFLNFSQPSLPSSPCPSSIFFQKITDICWIQHNKLQED